MALILASPPPSDYTPNLHIYIIQIQEEGKDDSNCTSQIPGTKYFDNESVLVELNWEEFLIIK